MSTRGYWILAGKAPDPNDLSCTCGLIRVGSRHLWLRVGTENPWSVASMLDDSQNNERSDETWNSLSPAVCPWSLLVRHSTVPVPCQLTSPLALFQAACICFWASVGLGFIRSSLAIGDKLGMTMTPGGSDSDGSHDRTTGTSTRHLRPSARGHAPCQSSGSGSESSAQRTAVG